VLAGLSPFSILCDWKRNSSIVKFVYFVTKKFVTKNYQFEGQYKLNLRVTKKNLSAKEIFDGKNTLDVTYD
jgi:hypothetical protein